MTLVTCKTYGWIRLCVQSLVKSDIVLYTVYERAFKKNNTIDCEPLYAFSDIYIFSHVFP